MRNRAPIFVNGFSRGGSNILVNLFLSHPEVCSPSGEIQEVFRGGARIEPWSRKMYKRLVYDIPVSLVTMRPLFSTSNLKRRPLLPHWSQKYLDWVLYREKLAARHEWHNRYVSEDVEYTSTEIQQSRLLCKSLNGLIFMTENFALMYSDATFFGLIRNGLAVCEGHVRRGRSAQDIGNMYNLVVDKILENAKSRDNYHLVRFEDILEDPIGKMRHLHELAGLNSSKLDKVRLQMKPVLTTTGEHQLRNGYDRQVVWYDVDRAKSHFQSDIDEIQIGNLSKCHRDQFLSVAGRTMERLGYL